MTGSSVGDRGVDASGPCSSQLSLGAECFDFVAYKILIDGVTCIKGIFMVIMRLVDMHDLQS